MKSRKIKDERRYFVELIILRCTEPQRLAERETAMASEALYRTVCQYNKAPVSAGDMERLQEIAEDCRKVKNYVYERYGGVGSISKIYPGYTVQNEMTRSGLRERLGLPSVYFYLAVFDALRDIKSQWTRTKSRIEKNIRANAGFTPEDRHYLRFVMKQSRCFEAILEGGEAVLTDDWKRAYEAVSAGVDVRKLAHYLRRQVRRHLVRPHTDAADGFTVSPKGYRYADHGIYLSMKESRRRLFIPLTDNNRYDRQIYVRLYPEDGNIVIRVPLAVKQKHPPGYGGELGLAMGMRCMFVTDGGNVYGERYLTYQSALTGYVYRKLAGRRRNAGNNSGKKKYNAGKARREEALHAYVNAEINRMLETERPGVVYIPKLPAVAKAGKNKKINVSVSMWQKSYVRNRLAHKCRERSIELVEVFAGGISSVCCSCGAEGVREGERFHCAVCGRDVPERWNTAGNVLKRGKELKSGRED